MKIYSLLIILLTLSAVHAGELDPPIVDEPESTMKTLTQVSPRKALVPNGQTITIDDPGSYYLAGNHDVDVVGIQINASNVTLDLNGFTLTGPAQDNVFGIQVSDDNNITIKNGMITAFSRGVFVSNASNVTITDAIIKSNTSVGIYLTNSTDNVIKNSIITDNAGNGIYSFTNNPVSSLKVVDSIVTSNGGRGIRTFTNGDILHAGMLDGVIALDNSNNDIELQQGLVINSVYATDNLSMDVHTTDSLDLAP